MVIAPCTPSCKSLSPALKSRTEDENRTHPNNPYFRRLIPGCPHLMYSQSTIDSCLVFRPRHESKRKIGRDRLPGERLVRWRLAEREWYFFDPVASGLVIADTGGCEFVLIITAISSDIFAVQAWAARFPWFSALERAGLKLRNLPE